MTSVMSHMSQLRMITFQSLSEAAVSSRCVLAGAPAAALADEAAPSPVSVACPPQSPDAPAAAATSPPFLPREEVLRLGSDVGRLCAALLEHAPPDPPGRSPLPGGGAEGEGGTASPFPATLADVPGSFWADGRPPGPGGRPESDPTPTAAAGTPGRRAIARAMGAAFVGLFVTAHTCGLDLRTCVLKKLELNGRKYPVELCRGKSDKYTEYTNETGITAEIRSQSTVGKKSSAGGGGGDIVADVADPSLTVSGVTSRIRRFATDRSWNRYHTPRNIVLAMMGEVGELAECFQWRGDDQGPGAAPVGLEGWPAEEVDHVGQELADVSIYLMRLADVCGIDLAREAMAEAKAMADSAAVEDTDGKELYDS